MSTMSDLGVAKAEVVLFHLQSSQHFLRHNLAVDEALRDGVGRQNGVSTHNNLPVNKMNTRNYRVLHFVNVPLFKLRVNHAVGEALATDTNALQHAVASQLMKHQVGVDLT